MGIIRRHHGRLNDGRFDNDQTDDIFDRSKSFLPELQLTRRLRHNFHQTTSSKRRSRQIHDRKTSSRDSKCAPEWRQGRKMPSMHYDRRLVLASNGRKSKENLWKRIQKHPSMFIARHCGFSLPSVAQNAFRRKVARFRHLLSLDDPFDLCRGPVFECWPSGF